MQPAGPRDLVAVEEAGFHPLPVTYEYTEAVRKLPRHHRDPFDRLIIASARVEGWSVLTSDSQFAKYDIELNDASTSALCNRSLRSTAR